MPGRASSHQLHPSTATWTGNDTKLAPRAAFGICGLPFAQALTRTGNCWQLTICGEFSDLGRRLATPSGVLACKVHDAWPATMRFPPGQCSTRSEALHRNRAEHPTPVPCSRACRQPG